MTTPVMTISDLCVYLHTSPATIYRIIKRQQLPYFRVGAGGRGDYRFNRESIDRWMELQEKKQHG